MTKLGYSREVVHFARRHLAPPWHSSSDGLAASLMRDFLCPRGACGRMGKAMRQRQFARSRRSKQVPLGTLPDCTSVRASIRHTTHSNAASSSLYPLPRLSSHWPSPELIAALGTNSIDEVPDPDGRPSNREEPHSKQSPKARQPFPPEQWAAGRR